MMLRVRSLDAHYGSLKVLKNISLHVEQGEIVSIIGANGAGKSTLLKTLSGLLPIKSGNLFLNRKSVRNHPPEAIVRLRCAHVPEGRQVFSPLSVRENLLLGAYVQSKRGNSSEIKKDLEYAFEVFPVLKERQSQLAGTLSGGEQQMLAMARALLSRPQLLMLDEPSMGLAPLMVKEIFRIITRLRAEGRTILLVEQNAKAALRISDRGYVIETGQILLEDTAEALLVNPEVQRAYLGKEYSSIGER